MQYQHPHTITNGAGELLTFTRLVKDPTGEWLEGENLVQPNSGPPMHVHHIQDEHLSVVQGKMGVQLLGEAPKYFGPGEGATFKAGVPHKFWNAGTEPLVCTAWVKPVYNMEYFLTELFKSIEANGGKRPGIFDAAYLLNRYRSEFDMLSIPNFVKKVVFPVVLFFGKLLGKYTKFEGAPEPVPFDQTQPTPQSLRNNIEVEVAS